MNLQSIPKRRLLPVLVAVAAATAWFVRRLRSSDASSDRADDHFAVSTHQTGGADVISTDPGGSWADDGGAQRGSPGDDPGRLSTSPGHTNRSGS